MPISETTWVSLSIVIGLVSSSVGATWFLGRILSSLKEQVRTLGNEVVGLRKDLKSLEEGQYSMARVSEDALWLKLWNPDLNVPNPRKPGEAIEQRGNH